MTGEHSNLAIWGDAIARGAAARERRRIRRALMGAMRLICLEHSKQPEEALDAMYRCIKAATKAPKKGKRK